MTTVNLGQVSFIYPPVEAAQTRRYLRNEKKRTPLTNPTHPCTLDTHKSQKVLKAGLLVSLGLGWLRGWREQTLTESTSRRCGSQTTNRRFSYHHLTSSIGSLSRHFPLQQPRSFTPNEVSMLPPTDYVFRSGVARCTLAGLAARTRGACCCRRAR